MGSNKTKFESKEVLVAQMKAALIHMATETDMPDELLIQYQAELEEVQSQNENELRSKGYII